MKKIILCLLILTLSLPGFGQQQQEDPALVAHGPRKQIATVIYAGLGGAVLGLSTLSFHGRPQDHLGSIAGGFAIGIIVGAIYSSYSVTSDPSKLHGENLKPNFEIEKSRLDSNTKSTQFFAYSWSF